jgi:hypothetical protein
VWDHSTDPVASLLEQKPSSRWAEAREVYNWTPELYTRSPTSDQSCRTLTSIAGRLIDDGKLAVSLPAALVRLSRKFLGFHDCPEHSSAAEHVLSGARLDIEHQESALVLD